MLAQDRKWVADTVLHEMVHMLLDFRDGDAGQDHGSRFAIEANRIGRGLGLKPVMPGTNDAIEWPQSRRKAGYVAWRDFEDRRE